MIARTTKLTVVAEGKPLFDESAFTVEICDEAGGEFVSVACNCPAAKEGEIRIDPEEWPALRDAIDQMVKNCKPNTP